MSGEQENTNRWKNLSKIWRKRASGRIVTIWGNLYLGWNGFEKKNSFKKKLSSPSNFASHFWDSNTNYYTNRCWYM